MCPQDFQHRCDIEEPQFQRVRRPVEQGRVPVLKQGRHFCVQGTEHDQASGHIGRFRGQAVDLSLQQRAEVGELLAMEILECVESDDETRFRKSSDQQGQFAKAGHLPFDAEGFEIAVAGGHHASRVRVGNLDVERPRDTRGAQRFLYQSRLADATTP